MRIILPFSPKMPYRRNLSVLRRAAAFLFFPFSGCRSSPSFFSFLLFFRLSPFLRMPSFMRGAFSFFLFSCTTEEKKEGCCVPFSLPFFSWGRGRKNFCPGKKKKRHRRYSWDAVLFRFLFFLLFLLFFSFSPYLFPGGSFEEGNPFLSSPFFVGFFVFGKKEKEEERLFVPFSAFGKIRRKECHKRGRIPHSATKRGGRRDGCSRHPLPVPSGRQNLACNGDFHKRRNSLSRSMKKLPRRQI